MANIRSVNEIILSLIDFFRTAQPDLDTKPGEVARDLFIDAPATQLALLYNELSSISDKQSLRVVVAQELDLLAKNYGLVRKRAKSSTGVALLTFSSIPSNINIKSGDIVTASNSLTFNVSNGVVLSSSASNFYRSVATRYRSQLDLVGITDEYAVEVTCSANASGIIGNIGSYFLSKTSIPGISNVTNINPFTGGTDQEDDATFRNRVLSSFSGASVGTALGYLNTALSSDAVVDAVVIEPGDSLMTRDGSEVRINTDGSRTIISEGSGGKVDVIVLGSSLVENTDSYIYVDKSNSNDPTNSKNNVVLGQIIGDENKTINRKRIDNIASGVLPKQPVESLLQITGSLSGSNFKEKSVDSYGRVTGNYELLKDTGVYAGGIWGFDTFHWISDRISLYEEDRVKSQFNGQDNLSFVGATKLSKAQQFVSINNENSIVNYDRSIIQLLHYPATNVTRVFNVNTGERYIITNQNLDETGTYNQTGRIKISGNTLPSSSDVLQVDYSWVITYDEHSDFDGLSNTSNPRAVTDSIDWGYSSVIKNEEIWFNLDSDGNFFTGVSSHPISSIISVKKFSTIDSVVSTVTTGVFNGRLAVTITNNPSPITNIESITLKNSNVELYNTAQANGSIINQSVIVGIDIFYNVTIILPSDTKSSLSNYVSVHFNSSDVYFSATNNGSFSNTQITIPATLIDVSGAESILLRTTYIANISELLSAGITLLPVSRLGNGFNLSNNLGFTNFSITNVSKKETATIQQNLSLQFYIDLGINSSEYSLIESQVMSVIRLSDGLELWNSNNPGTISISESGNYQLIFSGYNTPALTNRCLVIYYCTDSRRFQPYSYSNSIIHNRVDSLSLDGPTNRFYINLNKFVSQASGLKFTIFENNTDISSFDITDGYLISGSTNASISSLSENFATLPNLLNKKIRIFDATNPNNNGVYDIHSYNIATNVITIYNQVNNITHDQISVVRVIDGQEVWNYSGTIDISNNRILLPLGVSANLNDKVYLSIYNFKNLRKSPTKLSCVTTDQVISSGVITINGTTISKASDIIFSATDNGLEQNLSEALIKALNLKTNSNLPSNVKIAKIVKLEKVTTVSDYSDEVYSVDTVYDTFNTEIQNNLFYADEMLRSSNLSNTVFVLPSTQNNLLNLETKNLPAFGDKLRVTFYYYTDNDVENISYTRNGTLYTNKKFALINKIYVSSGFRNSQTTRLTTSSFTQPLFGSRYKIYYDYLAPKQNERISVKYNYNQLISDVTFNIESTRPINADVLTKSATTILLDLTMNVVIDPNYITSKTNVIQNLKNQLVTSLTSTKLQTVVDIVTLTNVAQAVPGISRARVLYFNKSGVVGSLLKIEAQKNEFFAAKNIIINTETR